MKRLLLVLCLGACASAAGPPARVTDLPLGAAGRRERHVQVTLDALTDTASGRPLTPDEAAARLREARVVFVGEDHTDPGAHEAQRRLIQALADTGRPVLIGLEMFPAEAQGALDAWRAGDLTEEQFVRASGWYRHWGYDFRLYRDIFLLARQRGLPMHGVNVPREVVTTVRRKGFAALSPQDRARLPPKVDTADAEHRRLFRAYFTAAGGHGGMTEAQWDGMFAAQCTWDAAMAWNAVRALEAHGAPDAVMVVLLGSGHVAFGLGAERQARGWFRGPTATVIPLAAGGPPVRASYADLIWGIPAAPELPPWPELGAGVADEKGKPHPVVRAVEPGSPAALAGVRPGDRVVAWDGATVPDKEALLALVARKEWGDGAAVEVLRDGRRQTLSVTFRRRAK